MQVIRYKTVINTGHRLRGRMFVLKCRKTVIAIALGILLIIAVIKGPLLIHLYYRMGTQESERQALKDHYHAISNAEAFDETLSDQEKREIRIERVQIYYWFHARGWPIDEGHHGIVWVRQWKDLFKYWGGAQTF